MTVSLVLVIVMSALYACAVYLLLERSLTRVLLGFLLAGNATNLLIIIMVGEAGLAPIFDPAIAPEEYTDPLPQALVLTAIVIGFAITAFLLGMIYRSWVLSHRDEITDDAEDRRVAVQSSYDEELDAEVPEEDSEFDDDEIDKHEKERAKELARHRREHESAERRRQRKEGRR